MLHRPDLIPRCYNAPSSNRIGWSVPLATHYQNNVTSGSWYNYTIPAMQLTDKNHVLVRAHHSVCPMRVAPHAVWL